MKGIQSVTSPFINIGERAQQLDMIQHIQEFSSMLVLVTGSAGVGKSAFINEAISQLSVHHQVLPLDALNSLSENNLLEHVSAHLGCGSSLADINTALIEVSEQGESLHLVVDDAHLLDDSSLNLLIDKSLQDKGWHLILCGDASLQPRLNELQIKLQQENIYHLIELTPLNEVEVGQFVEKLFQIPEQGSNSLSDKKKHQLWLLSKGLPGKLIELVEVEKESTLLSSSKFPIGHIAAILLIGVALVLSYAYQNPIVPVAKEDVIAQLLAQKKPSQQVAKPAQRNEKINVQAKEIVDTPENIEAEGQLTEPLQKPKSSLIAVNESVISEAVDKPKSEKNIASESKARPQINSKAAIPKATPDKHPLLRAQPQEYALQLLGVRHKKSAQAFMQRFSRQLSSEKLSVYETTYKGQPWFVVVYGPYQNKKNASNEAISLSRSLKSQPWVRPISKIQEDIRKVTQ